MEVHFLGTGAGSPAKERNVSALALRFLHHKSAIWLFDCGEATQHQVMKSPLTLAKIERIFITHMHGDHIFGLPGLLCSRSGQGATTPVTIYGPKEIKAFIEMSLQLSKSHLAFPIHYVETAPGVVFSNNDITVEAHPLHHVVPSFAFKIIESDQPGKLNSKKLRDDGVEPGPIYQEIKQGKVVTLPNGKKINGLDYVGKPKRGRSLVIAGDTRPVESLINFVENVDLLVHEGTFREDKRDLAHKYGHATIQDAAELARDASVKQLIITHISSRYVDQSPQLEQEAQTIFERSLIATDLMVFKMVH